MGGAGTVVVRTLAPMADARQGQNALYSWAETLTSVDLRVHLPSGTKRSQVKISLRAGEREAWRNQIETVGGAEMPALHPQLFVQPAFWPRPLIDGRLRGAVYLKGCSFQMEDTEGEGRDNDHSGGADLVIVLAKAHPSASDGGEWAEDGVWWGGVFLEDESAPAREGGVAELRQGSAQERAAEHASAEVTKPCWLTEAAATAQRMAGCLSDAEEQRVGTRACVALARRQGGVAALVAAKAVGLVADAMRRHRTDYDLQVAGVTLLSYIDPSTNEACALSLLEAALLEAAADAARHWPSDERLLLHATRAMLMFTTAGDACVNALLGAGGVGILANGLSSAPIVRELCCAALRRLACLGSRRVTVALVKEGAASVLLAHGVPHFDGSTSECAAEAGEREREKGSGQAGWRLRCWIVCHMLACSDETTAQQRMLSLGILPAAVALGNTIGERMPSIQTILDAAAALHSGGHRVCCNAILPHATKSG
jgi:hypothetical protein